jgi:hypothetical protein
VLCRGKQNQFAVSLPLLKPAVRVAGLGQWENLSQSNPELARHHPLLQLATGRFPSLGGSAASQKLLTFRLRPYNSSGWIGAGEPLDSPKKTRCP